MMGRLCEDFSTEMDNEVTLVNYIEIEPVFYDNDAPGNSRESGTGLSRTMCHIIVPLMMVSG